MRFLYLSQSRFALILVVTILLAMIHHPGYASLPACSLGEKHIDWSLHPGYASLPACSLGEKHIDWRWAPQNHIACFEQLSVANTHGRIQARSRLPMLYYPRLHAGSDAYPGQTPMIRVITLDESNRPAAAVRLELRRAGVVVGSAV